MKNIRELLFTLYELNIVPVIENDELYLEGDNSFLTQEIIKNVREHKAEIIHYMKSSPAWNSHKAIKQIVIVFEDLNKVWIPGLEPAWEWDAKVNEAFRKHDWNYFMDVLQLWKQHELKRIQEFQKNSVKEIV